MRITALETIVLAIPFTPLVTGYDLEHANHALADMRSGEALKPVLVR